MQHIEVMGDRAEIAEPGQLARAITDLSGPDIEIDAVRTPDEADMLVYTRRVATTLGEADRYCQDRGVPLTVMSTGIDNALPQNPDYPLVIAPNTGLRVLRFLDGVVEQAARLTDWSAHIVEHHQPTKKDTSGTAKKLAEMLSTDPEHIISVRDFEESRNAYPTITDENRASYAAHKVTFTGPSGDQESTDILILGRREYAIGLLVIFEALQRPEVQEYVAAKGNSVHVVDLLRAGFLG